MAILEQDHLIVEVKIEKDQRSIRFHKIYNEIVAPDGRHYLQTRVFPRFGLFTPDDYPTRSDTIELDDNNKLPNSVTFSDTTIYYIRLR